MRGIAASALGGIQTQNSFLTHAIPIAAGGLSGGVASFVAGGNFLDGVRNGLISAGLNHGFHELRFNVAYKKFQKGLNTLYSDEALAYRVMVKYTKESGNEIAAWITDKGVLVQPSGGCGKNCNWVENTPTSSANNGYPIARHNGSLVVKYENKWSKVLGQIHTHPSGDEGPFYFRNKQWVGDDIELVRRYGIPVFTIGPTNVHKGFFDPKFQDYNKTYLGHRDNFLNGKFSLYDFTN